MNFDAIADVLGPEAVDDVEQVTRSIYIKHGASTLGRQALTELLMAMVVAINARDHANCSEEEFRIKVHGLADELRSICIASRAVDRHSRQTS